MVIYKPDKAGVTLVTTAEALIAVPYLDDRTGNPFGLAIGLRAIYAGEFLPTTLSFAGLNKRMVVIPPIFLPILRIGVIILIGALIHNLSQKTR